MRDEFKWIMFTMGLGVSLTVFAHQNFATKEEVRSLKEILKTIDQRVYDIHLKVIEKEK